MARTRVENLPIGREDVQETEQIPNNVEEAEDVIRREEDTSRTEYDLSNIAAAYQKYEPPVDGYTDIFNLPPGYLTNMISNIVFAEPSTTLVQFYSGPWKSRT